MRSVELFSQFNFFHRHSFFFFPFSVSDSAQRSKTIRRGFSVENLIYILLAITARGNEMPCEQFLQQIEIPITFLRAKLVREKRGRFWFVVKIDHKAVVLCSFSYFPLLHSRAFWSVGAHRGGKPTFRFVLKFFIFGYYRTYPDGLWSNFESNVIYSGLIVLLKWEKWRFEGNV